MRLTVDVEDPSRALLRHGGAVGVITNSWASRPRRDDTMVVQMDGTARFGGCGFVSLLYPVRHQHARGFLPRGPPSGIGLCRSQNWQEMPDTLPTVKSLPAVLEAFLRHVAEDTPYVPTLVEGAKAVQLADLAYRSVAEQRWMDVPDLSL